MLNTTALCMSRSKIAEATTASPKISPQSGSPPIGRDDGGVLLFVALVHDLVEHGGGAAFHWEKADVVDHEDRWCGVGLQL